MTMDDGTDTYAYSYTQFNQLEEVAKNSSTFETCEYDLLGNQTVKYAEYSSGNPTAAVVYSYDLRNQLKDVGTTTDVTGLTNVTTINENIYNANGQRISKSEDSATEKYFYSGSALIYTKSGSGRMMTENILDLSGNIIASTRFDDDGDENTPNQWEGKYFFYHYDIRGSVTAIVDPDGESVKAYAYDEFGNLSESGEATFDNEVTFTGSIKDTSTGLQYMNARYYEPTTGRFITQDSYTGNPYDPWTQHLYSYCGNNPVNMIDPTGHKAMMIGGASYPSNDSNDRISEPDYGKLASGSAVMVIGAIAFAAALAVGTGGAGVPASLAIVAAATGTAGAYSMTTGFADMNEAFTGRNFIKENIGEELYYDSQLISCGVSAIGIQNLAPYLDSGSNSNSNNNSKNVNNTKIINPDDWRESDGKPRWPADNGFDGTTNPKFILEPGTIFDRYGDPGGYYASPFNTPYEQRSLFPGPRGDYNVYQVPKPIMVEKGFVAQWFGQPGGGVQYYFNQSIEELLDIGAIQQIGPNQ